MGSINTEPSQPNPALAITNTFKENNKSKANTK